MTINVGDSITASSYNTIQSTISGVLTTYYGAAVLSQPVATGNFVTLANWEALKNDVSRVWAHQTNATLTYNTGTILTANFANELESKADLGSTNKFTASAAQLSSTTLNSTSTRTTTPWGSSVQLTHRVTYTFNSTAERNYFFNLGGYLTPAISYSGGTNNTQNNNMKALIDTFNAQAANILYNKTRYDSGSYTYESEVLDGLNQTIRSVTVNYSLAGSTVVAEVIFLSVDSLDFTLLNEIVLWYSRGDLTPQGVAAPVPLAVTTIDLNTNGPLIPYETPTKKLTSNITSITNNFYATQFSPVTTITLTNTGNTALTFTNIQFNQPIDIIVNSPTNTFTLLPLSANSYTFTVRYTSNTVANTVGTIVITSDTDAGPYVINVTNNVTAIPFDFTLSPSSLITTVTTLDPIRQTVTIVPTPGTTIPSTPVYALTTGTNVSFNSGTNQIEFYPAGKLNQTYIDKLNVTIGAIQRSIPVEITLNAAQTYNLGNWVSALGYDNSVIGFSYDFINGERFLTVGIGMGADGSTTLNNGGTAFVSANNLNYTADVGYTNGVVLYKASGNSAWSSFMQAYAVWVRSDGTYEPYDVEMIRSYTFTAPATASYTWTAAIDNYGYVEIDGGLIFDSRDFGGTYADPQSGSITLSAGTHTIRFSVRNTSGPAGIAIRIDANLFWTIWSTLTPVRPLATPAYPFWSEVYRIPINANVPVTYNAGYCIKDLSLAEGKRYSDYFGTGDATGSIVRINNDGSNNLTIIINSLRSTSSVSNTTRATLVSLNNAFYYYDESMPRFTQLEIPFGNGQTRYFTGFTQAGVVTTSVQFHPSSGYDGFNCPAPWMMILLSDGCEIPAGDLKAGMKVKTQHEDTLEWGDFEVAGVEIHQESRILIKFNDFEFVCSPEHRLYHEGAWIHAKDIKPNMVFNGHAVNELLPYEFGDVVKITIKDAHTYICQGLLSHNIKFDGYNRYYWDYWDWWYRPIFPVDL